MTSELDAATFALYQAERQLRWRHSEYHKSIGERWEQKALSEWRMAEQARDQACADRATARQALCEVACNAL